MWGTGVEWTEDSTRLAHFGLKTAKNDASEVSASPILVPARVGTFVWTSLTQKWLRQSISLTTSKIEKSPRDHLELVEL